MRQVPHYTIVGRGRLASHFIDYFQHLRIPYTQWHRGHSEECLRLSCQESTHVLLLISDDAIENFFCVTLKSMLRMQMVVHCSAIVDVPGVEFAHPLMTFGPNPYSFAQYQKIPFVVSNKGPKLDCLLPGLDNPSVPISPDLRTKYHAYCVMSGNFTSLLWTVIGKRMQQEIGIDPKLMHPYLEQICENIIKSKRPLTGPFVRNDQKTMEHHQQCLHNSAWRNLYHTMHNIYLEEYHEQ